MQPRTHHRGYVLLLTLMLLAIAAASLAGICRLSLQKVVQAARAQDDLQRRWGVISSRAALLPKVETVLAKQTENAAEVSLQLDLGGQRFSLTFGDEQAKANLNLLYALGQREGAEKGIRALTQAAGSSLRVELTPMMVEPDDFELTEAGEEEPSLIDLQIHPVFQSWGQVFSNAPPRELVRRGGGTQRSVASLLTCWGDGLLNVNRASREALRQVAEPVLGPGAVSKLLAARDKDPEFDLWDALETLNLSEQRLEDAQQVLTDQSSCYSLWIVTRTSGREWYDLAVADVSAGGVSEVRSFSW